MENLRSFLKLLASSSLAYIVLVAFINATVAVGCEKNPYENIVYLGQQVDHRETITLSISDANRLTTQGSLLVRLLNLSVIGTNVTGFRVFINKPDASMETSIDDQHYLTSYSFFPVSSSTNGKGTFVIDLPISLLGGMPKNPSTEVSSQINITLVPIGERGSKIGLEDSSLVRR